MFIRWLQEKYRAMPQLILEHYRKEDRQKLLNTDYANFNQVHENIIHLLKQTAFYHGTGAYHYKFEKGDKYKGGKSKISYTLKDILKKGLVPQRDLLNEAFKTGATHSLSLTSNRLYARGYATLFNGKETSILYDYGPKLFWVLPIMVRVISGSLWGRLLQVFTASNEEIKSYRRNYRGMLKRWTHSFRKDDKYAGNFVRALWASSDIPYNFGFVIGIKHGIVDPLKIKYPNIGRDEVRTDKRVKPSDFSHIQVPLLRIEEVKKELRALDIDIPIIPMEYVALHEHKVGFRTLLSLSEGKDKELSTTCKYI